MRAKKTWIILLSLVCFAMVGDFLWNSGFLFHSSAESYPNFADNPYLDKRMRKLMQPHLIPKNHPIKPQLDALFAQSRVTENIQTLTAAGFTIIASMPGSFVTVARHPAIPGYVFKLYLDSEMRCKDQIPNWEWLTRRCIGADKIRREIRARKMQYFEIPDKWLYILPFCHLVEARINNPQPVVLVETDMQLENEEMTTLAWKNYVTPQHLEELYAILKHGYGSIGLVRNIPYTKKGTFAFTDTEYPIRRFKFREVKSYLSPEMQEQWQRISNCEKKKKRANRKTPQQL